MATLRHIGYRKLFLLFAVLLLATLLKHAWMAGYAHPVADDFCYAAKSRGMGLWKWSLGEWLNWNGRYASNLLMVHGPLSWSPAFLPGYRAIPVMLMAFTILAAWFLLRRATRHALSTGEELLAALVYTVLYLNLMPDLGEGFFWYTGAVTYQLASILFFIHLGLLSGKKARGAAGALNFLANMLLAVVITGMDEVHMVLMLALHVGRLAWLVAGKPEEALSGSALLAVVCAGAALMYYAPGNAVRGAMFADTHRLLPSLGMSFLQAVRFLGTWVLSPALLALSILYIPVHRLLKHRIPGFGELLRLSPWVAAALPVLAVVACTFPTYWSTGLLGQHRTVNVACMLFIPLWFLNLSLWMERRPLKELAQEELPAKAIGIAMLLAVLGLNLTRNGMAVNIDLLGGRAANYDRVMGQREAEVRAASRDPLAKVTFVQLKNAPLTLPNYEEHGPLRSWMVNCEARYFGAEDGQVEMKASWAGDH